MFSSVTAWLPVHMVLAAAQLGPWFSEEPQSVTAVAPTALELEIAPSIDVGNPAGHVLATLTPTPLPKLAAPSIGDRSGDAEPAHIRGDNLSESGVVIETELDETANQSAPSEDETWIRSAAVHDEPTDPAADAQLIETTPVQAPEIIVPAIATAPMLDTPFWDRVRGGFTLPEYDSKLVRNYEKFFSKRPDYMVRVLERAAPYLPYIMKQLEYRGMPHELILLPIVESAYNPFAKSHANALGMWQFIAPTAKRYDIRIDSWYDGRRDIIDSTQAALNYLQFLHDDLDGDWLVAIAAYNGGEHRMHREKKRNKKLGKPLGFDHLRLKKETRHYIPKLIALKNIFADPQRFGLNLPEIDYVPAFEVVWTNDQVDLDAIAKLAGMTLKDLRQLNPGFKRRSTPPGAGSRLLVPMDIAGQFNTALASADARTLSPRHTHRVRAGDSLSRIASKFGIQVGMLKRHNDLNSDLLQVGQHLTIPHGTLLLSSTNAVSSTKTIHRTRKSSKGHKQRLVYRVRKGDSLSTIASRFRVQADQIANWNKIDVNELIHRGQKLVIFVRG